MGQSIVDELVTLLGFKEDPNAHQTLNKFNEKIVSIGKIATIASGAIIGAATAIMYFAEKSAHAGQEIQKFHELTGMSTTSIQAWSYAARMIGGDKASILADIQSLTTSLNPLMPGQYNQGMFLFFGQHLKDIKTADQALKEMAPTFQRMSNQRALQWGNLMGLSPDMVVLLKSGKLEEYLKIGQKRALSPEAILEARRYAQTWEDMKDRIEKFSMRIAITLMPLLERMYSVMTKWWDKNHVIAEQGFKKFVDFTMKLIDNFTRMMHLLEAFVVIWVGGPLAGGISAIIGMFTKLTGLIVGATGAMEGFAAAEVEAAEAGVAGAAGGGIVAGVVSGLLAVLPAALIALLLGPTETANVDEESKIKTFDYNKSDWGKMLKGIKGIKGNRNMNMAFLERNGTDPALLARLRQAQGGSSSSTSTTNVNLGPIYTKADNGYDLGAELMSRLKHTNFGATGQAAPAN